MLEHQIAHGMAPGIVHPFEMVHIQSQDGTTSTRGRRGGQVLLQHRQKTAPIGQACQHIGASQGGQLLLFELALGDVMQQPNLPQ